jgi:hypothetical protein
MHLLRGHIALTDSTTPGCATQLDTDADMTKNVPSAARGTAGRLLEQFAPPDLRIPRRLGGGKLKEFVVRETRTRTVLRYSVAYINPQAFAGDNGRVLGYDNAHGRRHRHFLGVETDVPSMRYEDLLRLFNRQWRMLALQFVNGEELKIEP